MSIPDGERCIFIKRDGTRCTRRAVGDSVKDTSFGGGIETCEWHYRKPKPTKPRRQLGRPRKEKQGTCDVSAQQEQEPAASAPESMKTSDASSIPQRPEVRPWAELSPSTSSGKRKYARPKRQRRRQRRQGSQESQSEHRAASIDPGFKRLEMQYRLAALLYLRFENN